MNIYLREELHPRGLPVMMYSLTAINLLKLSSSVKVSMIPGALTSNEFEAKRDEIRAAGSFVVCYCTAGLRSFRYATSLIQNHGFSADKVI